MSVAIDRVLGESWKRMVVVCFKPFTLGKWLTLAFCAWLGSLSFNLLGQVNQLRTWYNLRAIFHPGARGGGPFGPPTAVPPISPPTAPMVPVPPGPPPVTPVPPGPGQVPGQPVAFTPWSSPSSPTSAPQEMVEKALMWLQNHVALVVTLAIVGLLVMGVVSMVLAWIRARGRFLFLDALVHNRGAVVEPWQRLRPLGNSLFKFEILWASLVLPAYLLVLVLVLGIVWPDVVHLVKVWPDRSALHWTGTLTAGVAVGGVLCLLLTLVNIITLALLHEFVEPIMYASGQRVGPAWGLFFKQVLPGHFWWIVLYFLLQLALGMVAGMAGLVLTCLTCCVFACVTAIPLLGTYIAIAATLPLVVYLRALSVYMLEALAPQFTIFPPNEPPPLPTAGAFPVPLPLPTGDEQPGELSPDDAAAPPEPPAAPGPEAPFRGA